MKIPNIEAIKKDFPDGYIMPVAVRLWYGLNPADNNFKAGIQCGEFVRILTGYIGPNGKWKSLSSGENKKALCIPGRDPQSGDIFVQDFKGDTDHIGFILRPTKIADGSSDCLVVHANSRGDSVVRYEVINSKKFYGVGPIGIKPKYAMDVEQNYTPTNNPIPTRYQYNYDICNPLSVVRAVEHLYGKQVRFSVAQLWAEMADAERNVQSAGKCLEWVSEMGLISEDLNPVIPHEANWKERWKETAKKMARRKRHKARGELLAGRVDQTTRSLLKAALGKGHVLIATTDSTRTDWDKGAKHDGKFNPNHTILITGFNERDEWIIANHWEGHETGVLHPDYPLSWVYQVIK